jgi:hypothetical protein
MSIAEKSTAVNRGKKTTGDDALTIHILYSEYSIETKNKSLQQVNSAQNFNS